MGDLDNRGQKSVDVASTYVQVLIGLASGIITAVLVFYPDILANTQFNPDYLKTSLLVFGTSVIFGLFGLGGLINSTANTNKSTPTNSNYVRIPVTLQLVTFGIGIMSLIIFVIPGEIKIG